MKVALVIKEFVPTRGGAERYSQTLALELARLGHNVHLFARSWEEPIPAALTMHRVFTPRKPSWLRLLCFSWQVRRLLSTQDFDIVYGLTQMAPQHLHRVGGGVHCHWLRLKYPQRWKRWLQFLKPVEWVSWYLEKKIFQPGNYHLIIANSHLVKSHVQQYFGVAEDRLRVIYNGVDPTLFHAANRAEVRQTVRAELGIGQEMMILFVSHNWERKGLTTLLQGAAPLLLRGEAVLVIVGRGKIRSCKHLIDPLGIAARVRFPGITSQIVRYYQAADVFVLPTKYDPFSNTCLEAMACRLPVITTTANGAAELIEEGVNGFVLENPEDFHRLTKCLESLLNLARRERISEQARRTAALYTPERNAQQTLEAFGAALAIGPS